MRKTLRILAIGLAILTSLAALLVIALYVWVSNPKHERQALPPELVSLESAEGKKLLAESDAKTDHEPLLGHYQSQEKQSWCGVASAVTVLNSLSNTTSGTQTNYFDECTSNVRSSFRTTFGGMALEQFARMIQCHDVEARVYHAESSSLDEFRKLASENLKTPGNFVVVNYDRSGVGQAPTGHISPVSAYHAASDQFLILDVASYKYPPVWAKASALWAAMNTPDSQSKRSRGYVLIEAKKSAR